MKEKVKKSKARKEEKSVASYNESVRSIWFCFALELVLSNQDVKVL